MMVMLKSGREIRFECEKYEINIFKLDGRISDFKYSNGKGECPVYMHTDDIELITVTTEGE